MQVTPARACPRGRSVQALARLAGFAVLLSAGVAMAQPAPPPAPPPTTQAAPPAAGAGSTAVVVMYHRFGEDAHPSTNVRVEQFEAHLRELAKPQYTVLPVPEIMAALREGRPLPERTVGITIDDAYRSILTVAWPRLKAAGLPFTVFVATEGVERGFRDLLGWTELRELVDSGRVSLGNHTVTHLHMPDHGRARNRRELREAGRRIAAETGRAPTLFAYPYGEYGTVVRKLVEEEGFAAAFGQHSGAIGPGSDRYALPRFALNEEYGDIERFRLAVNSLPLPARDVIPLDVLLTAQNNPPLFGFTVDAAAGPLEQLACYAAGQGRLTLQRIGPRRVETRPPRPFPPGRSRINCTLPAPEGRWRWYGVQFYLPGS
jgi:peptidoglycan/xylan/chitin deacetylase (PgdA/CDA1 family)